MNEKITNIVLASFNEGKLREIKKLFKPYNIELHSIKDYGLAEPIEDGKTFKENSFKKASLAAKATGKIALADDSGICIESLNGAPGVYSADWSEVNGERNFAIAIERVLTELKQKNAISPEQRKAFFCTCLCLCQPNGEAKYFSGEVHGAIIEKPKGTLGFGYDPIFLPDGYNKTFGEMSIIDKQKISHRARAFAQLIENIK